MDEYPVVYINDGEISDLNVENIDGFSEIRVPPIEQGTTGALNDYVWRLFVNHWCAV